MGVKKAGPPGSSHKTAGRRARTQTLPAAPDAPTANGVAAQERETLADRISADNPDPNDPRSARLAELSAREDEPHPPPQGAVSGQRIRSVVPDYEARRIAGLGQLTDAEPDTMTLHTRDAFRAFTGRRADASGKLAFIAGGQRYAATLKMIWYLSANDNPYADWSLIRTYEALKAVRDHLAGVTQARAEAIEMMKHRGLTVSVMSARKPRIVSLQFRSPYGYATADLIVEFDYYARMVKTLVHKDQLSDAQGHAAVFELERKMRTLFHAPIQWEHCLLREDLLPLRREDFLPGADEAARARANAAIVALGEVPRRVFTGVDTPRHTLRRVRLTDEQLRLLREVQLSTVQESGAADAELL